jgi:hypothetical protein
VDSWLRSLLLCVLLILLSCSWSCFIHVGLLRALRLLISSVWASYSWVSCFVLGWEPCNIWFLS